MGLTDSNCPAKAGFDRTKCDLFFLKFVDTARPVHALRDVCAEEIAESPEDICWQPFLCVGIEVVQY
jgi:hypothetical protein